MKLIKINYADQKQRNEIDELVINQQNCVKFYSKTLGCEIYIAPDVERADALVKAIPIQKKQVYLPNELSSVAMFSERDLLEYHTNKKGYA